MHSDTASQGDFIAAKRDVSLEESKQGREQASDSRVAGNFHNSISGGNNPMGRCLEF